MSVNNRDDDFDDENKTDGLAFLQTENEYDNDGKFDLTFKTADKEGTSVYIPIEMHSDLKQLSDVLDVSVGYILYRTFGDNKDYWTARANITSAMNKFRSSSEKYGWVEDVIELVDYMNSMEFEMRLSKYVKHESFPEMIGMAESIYDLIKSMDTAKDNSKMFKLIIESKYPDAKEVLKARLKRILDELEVDLDDLKIDE